MANEALEAHLQPGDDGLDRGPIENHLHVLATVRRLDVIALVNCLARIEESGPILRALLVRAADGDPLSDGESCLAFRGLHILGGARDQRVFAPLLRLLRRPEWELDALLGDSITETLARIIAGVFDGDVGALFAAIADRSIDEYARDALWGAATFLAWEGRIDRDLTRGFIERFYEERLASDEDYAWIGWLEAIALLGLRTLAPLAYKAWREGRVPPDVMELLDFERDLAEAKRAPDDAGRFKRAHLGYIEDVYEALGWNQYDDDGVDRQEDDPSWESPSSDSTEPAVNPWRHVGRNDPCPCGSGKKAKKCCLAQ